MVKVRDIAGRPYTPRQAAYDLKKLHGKNFVHRIGRSRHYQPIASGLRNLAALLVLREKVIRPVLAGAGRRKGGRPPASRTIIDQHYLCLQLQRRKLLDALKIAA